jgi:hypothetical protein
MSIYMPAVDLNRNFSACLAEARKGNFGPPAPEQRHVALITPGRLVMMLPCPHPEAVNPAMIAGIRAVVPEEQPQVISCIAFNDVVRMGALDVAKVNELIPFTGYLLGMAFLGHNVVVFEGHPSALATGCLEADLLIVDAPMADLLQEDWVAVAARAMRHPRILVFCRDGRLIRVDPSTERWVKIGGDPDPRNEPRKRWWWPF